MVHRSIVRIRRTENTKRSFNVCAWFCCYIILIALFHDQWYYITAVFFVATLFACCYLEKKRQQQIENDYVIDSVTEIDNPQIENDITSSQDIITIDLRHLDNDPVFATPLSPSNQDIDQNNAPIATVISEE